MASSKSIDARKTLRKLFPTRWVKAAAAESGAVIRQRKVDPTVLFWTVVLGFGCGRQRTLAGLRRSYERASGQCLEESSFYQRFNAGFSALLEQALLRALELDVGIGRELRGHLAKFVDVLITDSTVLRLHQLLARHWPGCRTNHTPAALKAHWVMSVAGNGRQSVKLTSEREHDGPVFKVGPWVAGRLLLFDLGYYGFSLFERIGRNGGFFLSRLKSSANPTIVSVNRTHRGRKVTLVGERLQDVLSKLKREVLDVNVEVRVQRRRYNARRRTVRMVLRLVGVRDPDTDRYHLYVTNIAPEGLAQTRGGQGAGLRRRPDDAGQPRPAARGASGPRPWRCAAQGAPVGNHLHHHRGGSAAAPGSTTTRNRGVEPAVVSIAPA